MQAKLECFILCENIICINNIIKYYIKFYLRIAKR